MVDLGCICHCHVGLDAITNGHDGDLNGSAFVRGASWRLRHERRGAMRVASPRSGEDM